MAIGCMASPIIGMVADRFFAGQKVLAALNLFSSAMLLLAGLTTNPDWLFLFLLLAMLFYMPTWGLTSSIAMAHAQPEQFSRIRVFGSVGWVVSGVFSIIMVKSFNIRFDGTNIPFFFASAVGFLAVIFNLYLPATPPSGIGKKTSVTDALGLRTVRLMKDRNFAIFIILSFLSMIPFSMYWSYCSEFLLDRKFEYISITMNLGQLAELLFMVTVPLCHTESWFTEYNDNRTYSSSDQIYCILHRFNHRYFSFLFNWDTGTWYHLRILLPWWTDLH
jgi:MFS family permease